MDGLCVIYIIGPRRDNDGNPRLLPVILAASVSFLFVRIPAAQERGIVEGDLPARVNVYERDHMTRVGALWCWRTWHILRYYVHNASRSYLKGSAMKAAEIGPTKPPSYYSSPCCQPFHTLVCKGLIFTCIGYRLGRHARRMYPPLDVKK